jgi:O-antigen/teichoic acid export membrane protein
MRSALGRNVVANMLSAVAGLSASIIAVPVILRHIGTDGYGVWVLGLTMIVYLSIADAGFGPAIQRWTAVARGSGDQTAATRLLWTSIAIYAAIAIPAALAFAALAPTLAGVFTDPGAMREDATQMFRLVSVALLLVLLTNAIGNVLQGLERFQAITLSAILGAAVQLTAILLLMAAGHGLPGLAEALVIQQVVVLLTRLVALRDVLSAARPGILQRAELRQVVGFAGRLQVNALAGLINSQSDKVVVGLVATAAVVGELGIASQLVDAGRLLVIAALTPIVSALAVTVGSGDHEQLRRQFAWMHRTWLYVIGGGTLIAMGALYPIVDGWIGGHQEAIVLGLVLTLANGISLGTGTAVAYLRAVGRPQLEARLGPVIVACNLVFTVPLAFAFGARGVVVGTLAAYVLGTVWFMRRFRALTPDLDHVAPRELVRPALLAAGAAGIALLGGWAATTILPAGLALVPVGVVTAIAFLSYLAIVTGRSLRPSALRTLVTQLRGTPA